MHDSNNEEKLASIRKMLDNLIIAAKIMITTQATLEAHRLSLEGNQDFPGIMEMMEGNDVTPMVGSAIMSNHEVMRSIISFIHEVGHCYDEEIDFVPKNQADLEALWRELQEVFKDESPVDLEDPELTDWFK
jgi:hypothetical protein